MFFFFHWLCDPNKKKLYIFLQFYYEDIVVTEARTHHDNVDENHSRQHDVTVNRSKNWLKNPKSRRMNIKDKDFESRSSWFPPLRLGIDPAGRVMSASSSNPSRTSSDNASVNGATESETPRRRPRRSSAPPGTSSRVHCYDPINYSCLKYKIIFC